MDPMQRVRIAEYDSSGSCIAVKQTAHRLMLTLLLMGCRREEAISIAGTIIPQSSDPKEDITYEWDDYQQKVVESLTENGYNYQLMLPLRISHSIRLRRSSFIILLGGTSGCGKSTLASILAAKLGNYKTIS